MSGQIKFTVPMEYDGKQVKEFLRRKCLVSASLLTGLKLVENGITRNGSHVRAIDYVKVGDSIAIAFPEDKNEIEPINIPLNIIFEDEHIIIFNKAPFMAVHPVHGHIDDTLANAAAFYAKEKGEHWTFRAVNRLDRNTSGAVLVAKNAYCASILSKTVKKKYIAVCEGILGNAGTINAPIGIKKGHSIQREVADGGVTAITHYKPIFSKNNCTLVEFDLETGRTHQIRVHMSYMGYPLAGDDMYGGSLERISRQALHCGELTFVHPVTQKKLDIKCPLPKDILNLLKGE